MAENDVFGSTGKIVAIIGGGIGIGEAVALGAARAGRGSRRASTTTPPPRDASPRRLRQRRRCGRSTCATRGQVAVGARRDRRERGRLDIVVCTPGINVRKPILSYSGDEFDRVVGVNLKGSFNVLQAAGRIMTAQQRGSIVIFSSIRSQVVEPGQSVYAMTKAGIVQLVRTAAAEFGPHGVRVNAVGPGVVETPLTAPIKANTEWYDAYANKSVLKRWARADEMVGPTLFLLLGRGELRHGNDPLCRRRLDGGRRPLYAPGRVRDLGK